MKMVKRFLRTSKADVISHRPSSAIEHDSEKAGENERDERKVSEMT